MILKLQMKNFVEKDELQIGMLNLIVTVHIARLMTQNVDNG